MMNSFQMTVKTDDDGIDDEIVDVVPYRRRREITPRGVSLRLRFLHRRFAVAVAFVVVIMVVVVPYK